MTAALGLCLVVLGGATDVVPSASAQTPANVAVAMLNNVSVPPRCTITTTMSTMSTMSAIDMHSTVGTPGSAVVSAVVAVCTRGTAQSVTLHLGAARSDCEIVPLDGGWATACGGPAAAAFIRALGLTPVREFKVYASVSNGTPAESIGDAATIAIEF